MGNSNDVSKIKCRIAVSTIIVVACVTLIACGNTSGSSKYNKIAVPEEQEQYYDNLKKVNGRYWRKYDITYVPAYKDLKDVDWLEDDEEFITNKVAERSKRRSFHIIKKVHESNVCFTHLFNHS